MSKKEVNYIKGKKLFFVTPDIHRALGLEKIWQDLFIICFDNNDTVNLLQKNGKNVFSLQQYFQQNKGSKAPHKLRSTRQLLLQKPVQEYIKKIKGHDKEINILVFKNTPGIEIVSKNLGYTLIASPSHTSSYIEDKTKFITLCQDEPDIFLPKWEIVTLKNQKFDDLIKKIGLPLVLQLPQGHAGQSTFFIDSIDSWERYLQLYQGQTAKISRYIEGLAATMNICLSHNFNYLSLPFWQIIKEPLLNKHPGGTGGNDYSLTKNLSNNHLNQLEKLAQKVSQIARYKGYLGWLGIDLVFNFQDELFYFIEANPRLVASSALFTNLQQENYQLIFMLEHIFSLSSFNRPYREQTPASLIDLPNFSASQIILRNTNNKSMITNSSQPTGIYPKFELKNIKKKTYDFSLLKKDAYLLYSQSKDQKISINIEFCQVLTRNCVLDNQGKLTPDWKKLISNIKQESLCPLDLKEKNSAIKEQ